MSYNITEVKKQCQCAKSNKLLQREFHLSIKLSIFNTFGMITSCTGNLYILKKCINYKLKY